MSFSHSQRPKRVRKRFFSFTQKLSIKIFLVPYLPWVYLFINLLYYFSILNKNPALAAACYSVVMRHHNQRNPLFIQGKQQIHNLP